MKNLWLSRKGCAMLRSLLCGVLALLPFMACSQETTVSTKEGEWPDGSRIEAWFTESSALQDSAAGVGRGTEAGALRFSIRDFGAVPFEEGAATPVMQTAAIQRAIDAAETAARALPADGPRTVVVIPAGIWYSGALFFKPGTSLYLEKGAFLKGSTDISDYPDASVHIEGKLQPYPAALVNAYAVDGFSITGEGVIDGNGLPYWEAFWARRKENRNCTNLEVRRPRMIYINHSHDVLIEGVHLLNSGFWTTHLYKCERVRLRNVEIYAPMKPVKAPSSDGVDLDACKWVHITGCSIATGDDLISLKGGKGPWADTDPDNGVNERILVENCHFGHGPGALVFGSECLGAKNVILRDSECNGTGRLIWLKMRPDTPQRYEWIRVERVTGQVERVVYIKPWKQFFDLQGRPDIPMSYASDILIRHCSMKCKKVWRVEEAPDQYLLTNFALLENEFDEAEKQ